MQKSIIATLTKYDVMFQIKQGFYLIYAIVTVLYLVILFSIPDSVRTELTAYLIISDTSIIGLTFMGALVLLEKQQGVLLSLFLTPVKLSSYLIAKAVSLTLIALITSFVIGFVPGGLTHNWPATIASVGLNSLFFSFLALGISARVDSLNDYLAGIMLGGLIMCLPIALYFFVPVLSLFFPINAAIDLLFVSINNQSLSLILLDVVVLIVWNIFAYRYAYFQFNKYVIHK